MKTQTNLCFLIRTTTDENENFFGKTAVYTFLSLIQIKNIKLHIVTDIKVTINSLSLFGFRYLVGGRVILLQKKIALRSILVVL